MSTIKVEIEVPTLPEGWEVCGFELPKTGDMVLSSHGFWAVAAFDSQDSHYIIARRKQSLAAWLNNHSDMQVLARVCPGSEGTTFRDGKWWSWGYMWRFPIPPVEGTVKIKDGKWVDVA